MSNPIPIQQPNINPPTLSGDQGGGIAVLMEALQHRQQLGIARKKLLQDQQEFELRQKLVGSQLAGADLEQEIKKRKMKEDLLNQDAAEEAHRIYVGHLPEMNDNQAYGKILAGIKDERVATALTHFRDQGLQTFKAAEDATRLQHGNANDTAVSGILMKYSGNLTDPKVFPKAFGEVAAVDPEAAQKLVSGFNASQGDWKALDTKTGKIVLVNSKNGQIRSTDLKGYVPGTDSPTAKKMAFSAGVALNSIDEIGRIIKGAGGKMDALSTPTTADVARATLGKLGLGNAASQRIIGEQRAQVVQALDGLAHAYASLLGGARSMPLYQSILSTYKPAAGATTATLIATFNRMLKLRPMLQAFASGKETDVTKLPDFQNAARILVSDTNTPADADSSAAAALPVQDYENAVPQ